MMPLSSVNTNENLTNDETKSSVSPSSSHLSNASNPDLSPQSDLRTDSSSNIRDKKDNRSKKKSFWFNSLCPTYKSRSEDLKKLFLDVPAEERLVVDYSCALQKEILVQGRLYITQNYLCFYANIFGWETNFTLKWKDIVAITKEKTNLVIPNAVLICTKSEKHFFTSLVQREETYSLLFRIWQNALMDQPMTQKEMRACIHQGYGSELGLTSDDENYISPDQSLQRDLRTDRSSNVRDKKDNRTKKESFWFNSLYPTYKSRSEDLKKIFPDVPAGELLVVDYSCALQKEILVRGRLYITQKYLYFYANIFGWETNLTLKWKDVVAVTKENTALVIPNAMLICTKSEKHFFTSLVQRDETYSLLSRIWQNALMDQPMTQQEMRACIYQGYGSELGLTSDDEDYISPDQSRQRDLRTDRSSNVRDKKDNRTKKESFWFNSLYPTYKSRSEDLKKIFLDMPADELLVVDYSCALQKEILVRGRLYITQKYLCFYANIFGWETNLTLKWKDVVAITKENTALVIPNAMLICTKSEKHFFTSLVQRDETYSLLSRIWQNALMDQPMTQQEMRACIHQCYVSELGLSSDDEDYISPDQNKEELSSRLSVVPFSEAEVNTRLDPIMDHILNEEKMDESKNLPRQSTALSPSINKDQIHPENSCSECYEPISFDSMESDYDTIECTASHEGRLFLDEIYPIHVDELFRLLFTSSKFYFDFHASWKTSDLTQTPWTHNPLDNSKSRVVNLTMSLGQTMGPKTCQVTEKQTMLPCSKSGRLYAVDIETVSAGVPYADIFYVNAHYCLRKLSDTHSSILVTGMVKFKRNVWDLVKGMSERYIWCGFEDFFANLKKALQAECENYMPEQRENIEESDE